MDKRGKLYRLMMVLVCLCLMISCYSQTKSRDSYWIKQARIAAGVLIAGFSDGQAEVISYDFRRYQRVHPNANPNWANPKISWTNKYKNNDPTQGEKFPGSTTIFVGLSDKYHLNRTIRNSMYAASVCVSITLYEKPKVKEVVKQTLFCWAMYSLGNGLAHAIYPK
jgi:hypothetical protein